MRLSLSFMGISPIDSTLPAVRAAERFGLDGVWSAEHIGFHDAIVPSALYLRETERLEVAVVGISTAGRHPGLIAMELSSLAELGPRTGPRPGRHGDPSLIAKLGKELARPARSTEELVSRAARRSPGRRDERRVPGLRLPRLQGEPLAPAAAGGRDGGAAADGAHRGTRGRRALDQHGCVAGLPQRHGARRRTRARSSGARSRQLPHHRGGARGDRRGSG